MKKGKKIFRLTGLKFDKNELQLEDNWEELMTQARSDWMGEDNDSEIREIVIGKDGYKVVGRG